MSGTETVALYHPDDVVGAGVGAAPRQVRAENLPARGIRGAGATPDGRVLVHRRAEGKDLWPGGTRRGLRRGGAGRGEPGRRYAPGAGRGGEHRGCPDRAGRTGFARVGTVVEDGPDGLRLWIAHRSPTVMSELADGGTCARLRWSSAAPTLGGAGSATGGPWHLDARACRAHRVVAVVVLRRRRCLPGVVRQPRVTPGAAADGGGHLPRRTPVRPRRSQTAPFRRSLHRAASPLPDPPAFPPDWDLPHVAGP